MIRLKIKEVIEVYEPKNLDNGGKIYKSFCRLSVDKDGTFTTEEAKVTTFTEKLKPVVDLEYNPSNTSSIVYNEKYKEYQIKALKQEVNYKQNSYQIKKVSWNQFVQLANLCYSLSGEYGKEIPERQNYFDSLLRCASVNVDITLEEKKEQEEKKDTKTKDELPF